MQKLKEGFYLLIYPESSRKILVYGHYDRSTNSDGYSFNNYDGGGFVSINGLPEGTQVESARVLLESVYDDACNNLARAHTIICEFERGALKTPISR